MYVQKMHDFFVVFVQNMIQMSFLGIIPLFKNIIWGTSAAYFTTTLCCIFLHLYDMYLCNLMHFACTLCVQVLYSNFEHNYGIFYEINDKVTCNVWNQKNAMYVNYMILYTHITYNTCTSYMLQTWIIYNTYKIHHVIKYKNVHNRQWPCIIIHFVCSVHNMMMFSIDTYR